MTVTRSEGAAPGGRDARVEVLEWAQSHGWHRFDLANSAVSTPDLEALGLPSRAGIPSGGLRTVGALEEALGARYAAPGGRVAVVAGASEANASVFLALLAPGDEVLVETPGYQPHRRVATILGARVRTFPRLGGDEGLVSAIESGLTPSTRMVVLSDLHNPVGGALSESTIRDLEALAERRSLWLLADETFRDADDRPLATLASRSARWVTTSSLTKSYGLGALRIGWVSAAGPTLERCHHARHALSVEPSHLSAGLALELAPHLDALRRRSRAILETNHRRWADFAGRHPRLCRGTPRGTTAWVEFPGAQQGDAFSERAAAAFDLAVQPGRFFGDARGIRVTLGGEPDRFAAALETLERACAEFLGAASAAEPA